MLMANENMEISEIYEYTDSELNYFVRNALKSAIEDNCNPYHELLLALSHGKSLSVDEAATLVTCLKALTAAVSCLHYEHHQKLFTYVLNMRLWDYGTDVMDALVGFVVSLAAIGTYLDLCLEMLVINFTPPLSYKNEWETLKKPRGIAKKNNVLDRIHTSLHYIAHVQPRLPSKLEEIVVNRMPKIQAKTVQLELYVENMLRLEASALGEMLRNPLLVKIVDTLVELDVGIPWCDILQDDFHKGIFDMELEDLDTQFDHVEPDGNVLTTAAVIQSLNSEKFSADSLDSLMVLTFEHLRSCHDSGRLVQVFDVLLQSFPKTVLTAYKSKFAQFVMFYACSLDPESCGAKFANLLFDIFLGSYGSFGSYTLEQRMSAVTYLSSYLARAKFVSIFIVGAMLESLLDWCLDYCKNHDGGVDPRAHKLFYAGCQATMYVLCFRMRQIIAEPNIDSHLLSMRLKEIFGHRLAPLQVCLPSIVEEFLSLAKANGLSNMPQSFVSDSQLESENSQAYGGLQRFDTFFPFDPCLLRKCDSFIRPNYLYWSMVRSSYEEDEDIAGDTSDEDDVEAQTIENGMAIPDHNGNGRIYDEENSDEENIDIDEFRDTLDKMSITPKDSSHKFGGRIKSFSQMPSRIRPSTSPESL